MHAFLVLSADQKGDVRGGAVEDLDGRPFPTFELARPLICVKTWRPGRIGRLEQLRTPVTGSKPLDDADGPGESVENHRTRFGRERRRRTGRRILKAVFDAVDHDGVDRLSIDRVKDLAGLSRGSFYNYAATLDEMLSKVSFLAWRQVNTEQQELFGRLDDPLKQLAGYLRYGVLRSASDRSCAQIMVRSLPLTGVFSLQMWERLTATFALAKERGQIEVESVEVAVETSMGGVLAMLRYAVHHGPDPAAVDQQALMLLRGLGARKSRLTTLLATPSPDRPTTSLRSKLLEAGWD